jgi:hypothetical protein
VLDVTELDPLSMEAARFIHLIALSSSLTLQMLIGAGGLSVLTTMASFGCRINFPAPVKKRINSWENLLSADKEKSMNKGVDFTDSETSTSQRPVSLSLNTNVNELDSQFNFEIYPNPFQNQFTVRFNEKVQGPAEIKIIRMRHSLDGLIKFNSDFTESTFIAQRSAEEFHKIIMSLYTQEVYNSAGKMLPKFKTKF